MYDTTEPFERFVLNSIRLAINRRLPTYLVDDEVTKAIVRDELHMLVIELRTQVLGDQLRNQTATGTAVAEFWRPVNWREHWKQAHRSTWYGRLVCRRWPIKPNELVTRTAPVRVDIERYRVFPEASPRQFPPGLGRPYIMMIPKPIDIGGWSPEVGHA